MRPQPVEETYVAKEPAKKSRPAKTTTASPASAAPKRPTANKAAPKTGRACSTGILGVAAFGDASLDAAKKAGGITSVHSVEYEATALLGVVYVVACTIVHGA